ncbi:MAG: hypothetical protein WA432_03020 [Candidatus Babeliaceae bacterium]
MKKTNILFILFIALLPLKLLSNTRKYAVTQALKTQAAMYKDKFANILLVINFNHPYYKNIDFIKELYVPFFSNIVFYGESSHPQVTAVPTHMGYLLAYVVHDVLIKYPSYDGYLFLEDDCILNVWNCLSLNLDKIWLPGFSNKVNEVCLENSSFIANLKDGTNANTWWWRAEWGIGPTKKAFSPLSAHDLEMIEKNAGKNNAVGAMADMFYIPGRFSNDVVRLADVFKDVFVEIAIPCILCCLDLKENWERTSILWGVADSIVQSHWPMLFICVHPLKLSLQKNRNLIRKVFNTMIPQ